MRLNFRPSDTVVPRQTELPPPPPPPPPPLPSIPHSQPSNSQMLPRPQHRAHPGYYASSSSAARMHPYDTGGEGDGGHGGVPGGRGAGLSSSVSLLPDAGAVRDISQAGRHAAQLHISPPPPRNAGSTVRRAMGRRGLVCIIIALAVLAVPLAVPIAVSRGLGVITSPTSQAAVTAANAEAFLSPLQQHGQHENHEQPEQQQRQENLDNFPQPRDQLGLPTAPQPANSAHSQMPPVPPAAKDTPYTMGAAIPPNGPLPTGYQQAAESAELSSDAARATADTVGAVGVVANETPGSLQLHEQPLSAKHDSFVMGVVPHPQDDQLHRQQQQHLQSHGQSQHVQDYRQQVQAPIAQRPTHSAAVASQTAAQAPHAAQAAQAARAARAVHTTHAAQGTHTAPSNIVAGAAYAHDTASRSSVASARRAAAWQHKGGRATQHEGGGGNRRGGGIRAGPVGAVGTPVAVMAGTTGRQPRQARLGSTEGAAASGPSAAASGSIPSSAAVTAAATAAALARFAVVRHGRLFVAETLEARMNGEVLAFNARRDKGRVPRSHAAVSALRSTLGLPTHSSCGGARLSVVRAARVPGELEVELTSGSGSGSESVSCGTPGHTTGIGSAKRTCVARAAVDDVRALHLCRVGGQQFVVQAPRAGSDGAAAGIRAAAGTRAAAGARAQRVWGPLTGRVRVTLDDGSLLGATVVCGGRVWSQFVSVAQVRAAVAAADAAERGGGDGDSGVAGNTGGGEGVVVGGRWSFEVFLYDSNTKHKGS